MSTSSSSSLSSTGVSSIGFLKKLTSTAPINAPTIAEIIKPGIFVETGKIINPPQAAFVVTSNAYAIAVLIDVHAIRQGITRNGSFAANGIVPFDIPTKFIKKALLPALRSSSVYFFGAICVAIAIAIGGIIIATT